MPVCLNCLSMPGQICVPCSEREIQMLRVTIDNQITELTMEKYRSTSQQKDLEWRLNFLRLPFYDEPDDETTTKTDVKIVAYDRPDEPLHAHKFVLADKSRIFSNVFTEFGIERQKRETQVVPIFDATLLVMQEVIRFCYSADIDFSKDVTVEEVLEVAHKYEIEYLGKICEAHLIKSLNSTNLSSTLKLAKKLGSNDLRAAALKYLQNHFDEVANIVFDELI